MSDAAGRVRGRMVLRAASPADLDQVVAIERASFSDPWRREAFMVALDRPEVFFCVAVGDVAVAGDVGAAGELGDAGAACGAGTGAAAPAEPPTGGPEGLVLGYVLAWFVVGEGEVANIAVRPECRGRGVGAALLDATLDAARRRRTTEVFLEVRESNAPAQSLYASRGFRQVGRRRGYYRSPVEDALLLKWEPGPGGG